MTSPPPDRSPISEERVIQLAEIGVSGNAIGRLFFDGVKESLRTAASEGYRNGMERAAEICLDCNLKTGSAAAILAEAGGVEGKK